MVRKLQVGEYLKRYDNMSAEERAAYQERVGRWLGSGGKALLLKADEFEIRLKNVFQASIGWNDTECAAFEEGAKLLSAIGGKSDTWLPDLLYVKAAGRCIRKIVNSLSSITLTSKDGKDAGLYQRLEDVPASTTQKGIAKEQFLADGVRHAPDASGSVSSMPVRPKHIDQYVHLLPEKTRERAGEVRDLLRELDSAREKARLLMGSPQANPADMGSWAKKATQIDNKLRSIYDELDREWEHLVKSGRVAVDALGNVSVSDTDSKSPSGDEKEKPELTSEQKARRRELRKWLIDTRRGNGNARKKRIEQWRQNFSEYLILEGESAYKDEKITEAAKHYGIDLTTNSTN